MPRTRKPAESAVVARPYPTDEDRRTVADFRRLTVTPSAARAADARGLDSCFWRLCFVRCFRRPPDHLRMLLSNQRARSKPVAPNQQLYQITNGAKNSGVIGTSWLKNDLVYQKNALKPIVLKCICATRRALCYPIIRGRQASI